MAKKPVKITPEIMKDICFQLRTSHFMLEELCEKNPHWPCCQSIYEWRIKDPSFGEMFARAKQAQIEVLVARIFNLARSKENLYLYGKDDIPFAEIGRASCRERV